jgi:ArsR family transcriptional regulator
MDQVPALLAQPDAMLSWMECLADPTRLRLLRLLERHELGVAELCDVLQLPQSTVSRHLKVLSDQQWARSRRQATTHLYRMVLDELEPPARRLWLLAREQTAPWATAHQDELRLEELLRQKQSDSQAFFAGAAARWDRLRDELYGQNFPRLAMLALLPSDWVIADLGCGTGQVAAELSGCVKQVIAVDNSAAMLKAARRRTADLPNVDLRRGDLESLPIEDGACDAALLLLALTYVPEPLPVVREMARILKPGGRAVVVDLLPHDREEFRIEMGQQRRGLDESEMNDLLHQGGLEPMFYRSLAPETGVKGPGLFLSAAARGTAPRPS